MITEVYKANLQRKMTAKKIIVAIALHIGILTAYANTEDAFILRSPDKTLELVITQNGKGYFTYRLSAHERKVIDDSPLGFKLENGNSVPSPDWRIEKTAKRKNKSVWKPLWGKRNIVPNKYNELKIDLRNEKNSGEQLSIVARAYNDGIAFRYDIPENSTLQQKVAAELTSYQFADNYTAWYYNGERHNIGPEKLCDTDGERMPMMTIQAANNLFMAIHEACLNEGEPLKLYSRKGENLFTLQSKPESLHSGYQSAWRVIFCTSTPGELVDSHLLELLNPDPDPNMDFSWVKPGISLWDWRINGAEWKGFKYTMSYPSWVRMVDFAAEQGFPYLMLDANWYGPEFSQNSDPVKGEKAKDVQRIIQYGKEKNVGIWLYLNDVGGKHYPLEQTLQQYSQWGASGVKYGFMFGKADYKNRKTQEITQLCAKHKLLIDFHDGPVHPYGQMRTWPNAVTREYCKAQLDGKEIFYPKTFVTSVFVNMIAGPLDMNNGMFDLRQGRTTRVDNNQEVPSTVVAEAARTLITFSGTTVIPDIPEMYEKYPALLRFLSAQKMPWKESRTLAGEIGKYIVMMRQADDDTYLIGAATNEEERSIDIPLSFLPKGEFEMEMVTDGENSHYLSNREECRIKTESVTRKNTQTLWMAPGGGACVILKKKQQVSLKNK